MKYAIVTGGTSGIGLGVAKMLLGKGYYVYATYIGPDFMEEIDNFEALKIDQTCRNEVYQFINHVKSKTNHVDCIICNAGMSIRKSFTETTDDDWDRQMEVAVNSHYIMVRELYRMIPRGSRIIFTGSQMAIHPNAIIPGFVETPWQKEKPEEIKQNIYKKTAIHRFATIDEIVDAYRFCIDNPFVNGSLIEVNGGYSYK